MLLDPTLEDDFRIISALRGPDWMDERNWSEPNRVKAMTTCVLRYFVGMEEFGAWGCRNPEITIARYSEKLFEPLNVPQHFGWHFWAAFKSLKKKLQTSPNLSRLENYGVWIERFLPQVKFCPD